MKQKEFCATCESLGKSCDGLDTSTCYTGCVFRKHWTDKGRLVTVKNPLYHDLGVGTIKEYLYQTGDYIVDFAKAGEAQNIFIFKQSALAPA